MKIEDSLPLPVIPVFVRTRYSLSGGAENSRGEADADIWRQLLQTKLSVESGCDLVFGQLLVREGGPQFDDGCLLACLRTPNALSELSAKLVVCLILLSVCQRRCGRV
ncbi:hypothetical protein Mp_1g08240 [Marchantia polymorpha subsp. ruderalis]|uniref:Uncharacterized protein n=2 Tax=Marchantia polymorpha TaxID=3197 RepID=A0AAF6AMV4_MARPO|nr:hypothetical protein MARPO_0036s0067 [Marchantia polymorpha]BBM97774.1 hypothetical protein Mp_1g08240 [Marchantia polymorpha subsp. ruderalis]|eukprot:PTQ41077.1 hypothetical protein MARPO_0036s0067 [Marchantia polymorpha]